jgi:hypothetical protein
MRGKDYEMIAGVINTLPASIKDSAADHFARELHARLGSFDLAAWEARTGGTLKRFKREGDEERTARVLAYADGVLKRSARSAAEPT